MFPSKKSMLLAATVMLVAAAPQGAVQPGPSAAAAVVTGPTKIIGMSAPNEMWDRRLTEVGASGVTARRIFADLTSTGTDQLRLVSEVVADGMMPVISYKVPDAATAARGGYNAWARTAAEKLAALNAPVTVTFWHEPHGDMTPAQFIAGNRQILPAFKRGKIHVGPLLNGWLLDNQVSAFASYTSADLFALWDFIGIDTYQSGTSSNPGARLPGSRIPKLVTWLRSINQGSEPIGVGEYNGHTAEAIRHAGDVFLSTPTLWFACMWNSTGSSLGVPLSGARLDAFRATKRDTRVAR